MSERYIEKSFLYLLALSVLLHLGAFGLVSLIPPAQPPKQKVTTVDLTELPELPKIEAPKPKPPPPEEKPKPLPKPVPHPVPGKKHLEWSGDVDAGPVSKGSDIKADDRPVKDVESKRGSNTAAKTGTGQQEAPSAGKADSVFQTAEKGGQEAVRGSKFELSKLFPSARTMTNLEESYRRKYRGSEQGDTLMMDTDNIRFGSFMRRFETAIYGVWRYPEAAIQQGIQGTTPVRITFNRAGEIVGVELLESSGSAILDDEVFRTLKQLGPIGSLPKSYTYETFNVIAFFQYGMGRGWLY